MNYSVVGLVLDLVGVILLGVDLLRLQSVTRRRAKEGRALFEEIETAYGGIESWADDLMKQSEWIPNYVYADHHSEHEVSYNARHALDTLRDVASAVNGLAAHTTEITKVLYRNMELDKRMASASTWFSVFGLIFLVLGFGLQIVGVWQTY